MRRRALLTAVGFSAAVPTAGCLDAVDDRGGQRIRLARFSVANWDLAPHQFDLRVDRDAETVHLSSYQIRGRGEYRIYGEVADCDWGTTPDAYEVFARADGGEWTSKPLADVKDGWRDSVECATAHAEYYETGDFWLRLRDNCERFVPSGSTEACSIEHETGK